MPTNIQFIQTEDFIRAKPDGSLDFAESRSLLKDLLSVSDTAGAFHILLDTREADVRLFTAEIFELGVMVADEGTLRPRRKLALLVPSEKHVDASFFETVSTNRGAHVKMFADFETAVTWLIIKEHP